MSIARNLASLFSASTSAATDSEVTAAIATHNTSANGHVKRGGTASRPNSPSSGDLYYNTDLDTLESYDGTSWFSANAIPLSPSSVVATNQPSGRAFNNGQASIAFTPNSRSGKTTSYTVTSSPGGYTASASSSPIVITGLQSSTQYTYTVAANGPFGTSVASSASSGVTATTVPEAPTIGTPSASGNAYSTTTSSLSVPVTANATGGSAITSYTVTSNPGSFTASGASGPLSVSGLSVGTAYTFTATATNENGTSLNSSASASTTVTTVPQAPTIGTATDGGTGTTASVAFTAGATGGSAITTYTATSSPGSITGTAASSPITVSGLTTGQAYTFTVTATNANGTSTSSAASNSVTLAIPTNFEFIASTKATGSLSYTLSNIPQTYKSLQLRIFNVNYGNNILVRLNSASSGHYEQYWAAAAGGATSTSFRANSDIYTGPWSNGGAPLIIIDIPMYLGTNTKSSFVSSSTGVAYVSGSGSDNINALAGVYDSTTAVTEINVRIGVNAWYGTIALYGLQ
jgi:hypothetical protein